MDNTIEFSMDDYEVQFGEEDALEGVGLFDPLSESFQDTEIIDSRAAQLRPNMLDEPTSDTQNTRNLSKRSIIDRMREEKDSDKDSFFDF